MGSLKYLSKFGGVSFVQNQANSFDEPSGYVQLFSTDDIIRFQAIAEDGGSAAAVIENTETGETERVTGTDTGIAWDNYSVVDFDLTGGIRGEGLYKITIRTSLFDIAETYIRAADPGSALLENTVRIRYTHRRNEFDTAFIDSAGVQNFFDFRIEGGFLYKDIKFNVSADSFRDQRYTQNQLSNLPYRVKTFTAGTGRGVPFWVGERLNLIFSCSDITIDGVRHVRSEEAVPELTEIKDHYTRFVYRLNVEETDNYKQPLQYDAGKVFSLTLEVAAGKLQNVLPFTDNTDLMIDWGDGTVEHFTGAVNYPVHKYAAPGAYTVQAVGKAGRMALSTISSSEASAHDNFKNNLACIESWGELGVTSVIYGLLNCVNLTYINPDAGDFFRNTTLIRSMFSGCVKLQNAFTSFNAPLLVAAESVFTKCSDLAEMPAGLFTNCPDLESVEGIFSDCTALTEVPPDLFAPAAKLKNVGGAFSGCSKLTVFPDFSANRNVENAAALFRRCTGLASIPDHYFSTFQNAVSFSDVFAFCNFTSIPADLFTGCSKVTDFSYAFNTCSHLTSVPAGLFSPCPGVTKFTGVFKGCSALSSLPADLFRYNTLASDYSYVFAVCTALTGGSPVNADGLKLWQLAGQPGYPQTVSGRYCFYQCYGLSDYNSVPANWRA